MTGGETPRRGRKPAAPGGQRLSLYVYDRHVALVDRWQRELGLATRSEAAQAILDAAERLRPRRVRQGRGTTPGP